MSASVLGRVLGLAVLALVLAVAAVALLGSRYALPWQGTSLERRVATRCSVPVGITYHVEVVPLEHLPIFAVRCAAVGYLTVPSWSPGQRMEAQGILNTSPAVPASVLGLLAPHSGWYLIEQRVLVDARTLAAQPAGVTARPLGSL